MKLRFTNILLLLLSLLAYSSCVFDDFGECPSGGGLSPEGEKQYVTLDLKISMNDGIAPESRASADVNDYGDLANNPFEGPIDQYEKVNSLRVIIVRADGSIEHNRKVGVKEGYGSLIESDDVINDNLQFKIAAGEKKRIYLFANESAVFGNVDEYKSNPLAKLKTGDKLDHDEVDSIRITRKENEAFIDNNGNGRKSYIPMSEFFDVTIPEFNEIPDENGNINTGVAEKYLTETLFLTRSLIKFSFTVQLKKRTGESTEDDVFINKIQYALKGVKITNLANECYYLPRETTYSPAKYEESDRELGGREITDFEVPAEAGASDYTFEFKENLTISSEKAATGSILTYFPESKTTRKDPEKPYMLELILTGDYQDYYEPQPLKLINIPRNTHVLINLILSEATIEATVKLVPYIGVTLNYPFGFTELVEWKKPDNNNNDEPSLEGENKVETLGQNDPGTPGVPGSGS